MRALNLAIALTVAQLVAAPALAGRQRPTVRLLAPSPSASDLVWCLALPDGELRPLSTFCASAKPAHPGECLSVDATTAPTMRLCYSAARWAEIVTWCAEHPAEPCPSRASGPPVPCGEGCSATCGATYDLCGEVVP